MVTNRKFNSSKEKHIIPHGIGIIKIIDARLWFIMQLLKY